LTVAYWTRVVVHPRKWWRARRAAKILVRMVRDGEVLYDRERETFRLSSKGKRPTSER
jgi:hypothetical protein